MSSTEMKVLIFSLNNEFYGINIMDVERILGFEKPTLIPDVMEGVINYETGILPIINLKKKFSLNPQSSNDQDSKIVVTKEQTNKFGILVDNVYEVKDINTSSIEMSKAITSAISGRYIEGLINSISLYIDADI